MAKLETVEVVRKDHPYGSVVINKCDMKADDIESGKEPKIVPKARRTTASKKVSK